MAKVVRLNAKEELYFFCTPVYTQVRATSLRQAEELNREHLDMVCADEAQPDHEKAIVQKFIPQGEA